MLKTRTLRALLVAIGCTCVVETAVAAPYEVYARYHKRSATSEVVRIDVKEGLLARGLNGYVFDGIYLRLKESAKEELGRYRNITYNYVCANPCESNCQTEPNPQSILPTDYSEHLVIPPQLVNGSTAQAQFKLDVHAKFLAEFLCSREVYARMQSGKSVADDIARLYPQPVVPAPAPPPAAPRPANAAPPTSATVAKEVLINDAQRDYSYSMLFDQGLLHDGKPIVYSFCKKISPSINYTELAEREKKRVAGSTVTADDVRKREKAALSELLGPILADATTVGEIRAKVEAPGHPQNTFAYADHIFAVLRAPESDFSIQEDDHPFRNHIANDTSTIWLTPKSTNLCREMPCDEFIPRLAAYVDFTDKDGNDVHSKVDLKKIGNRWALALDLRDHLNKTLSFSIKAKYGDTEYEFLREGPITVRDLGVVMSVPVISEVVSAITKSPGKVSDLTIQSSIPISYAISLHDKSPSQAAITFPWMIGINTSSLPNLADYVRIFPHVSLVFPAPGGSSQKTQTAFGGGVALGQVLAFSYAYSIGDTPTPYFMVGVSAPDLVKFFQSVQ